MAHKEIYFSTDIETDGPIPGEYSMLSFASVALTSDGKELGTFEANLYSLPGAKQDPNVMQFWSENQEAYDACRQNCQEPEVAIKNFVDWVTKLSSKEKSIPVMVAMPAGFDFTFMYWYMMKFAKKSPFSHSCLDIKSYVMAIRNNRYRQSSKRFWPKRWFADLPHTHVALDDAREQGYTFINILNENNENLKKKK